MAAYDYGGGCPCGLYRECPPDCEHNTQKVQKMNINDQDDFGFSLVSESELKSIEETLAKKLTEKEQEVEMTSAHLSGKMKGLVDMIMPLLNNLCSEPDKEYIYWPDRVERIKKFKLKVEKYINS